MAKKIILDIQTTGLNSENDEIIQIGIINAKNGKVLFDSMVRPMKKKRWPEAQSVNGIAPEDVQNAPTLSELRPKLIKIFKKAHTIIGYSIDFDIEFLKQSGFNFDGIKFEDMLCYNYDDDGYFRSTLHSAAMTYGFDWDDDNGDSSITNCFATLCIYEHNKK